MRDLAAELLRALAHDARALDVVGGGAVREVEAHDVDAGGEHARHDGGRAAGGTERCDDLGGARHFMGILVVVGRDSEPAMLREFARIAIRAAQQSGARFEHRHGGQRLAFEEFEERAAAGRDVADAVGEAELGDRRERVAAARDRERVARRRSPPRSPSCRPRMPRTRTRRPGRSRRSCRPCAMIIFSAATDVGPMSRMRSSGSTFSMAFSVAFAVSLNSLAMTASIGHRHLAGKLRRGSPSLRRRGRASASELPILPPAARMNVLAMPPPTISASTLASSARRIVSLVETFDPATIATSGRAGIGERACRARRAPPPSAGRRRRPARTSRCRASSLRRDARCRRRR